MSDEHGFTLVELIAAIAMTTIVIIAASTMIISSLNTSDQVTGRIAALQEGRTGLEALLGQLNSGCLIGGTSPVQAATSGITPQVTTGQNALVFVSSEDGSSANPAPTEHVVALSPSGALVDTAYTWTGTGTGPSSWTFSPKSSTAITLAEKATAGSGPMFSYYAYAGASDSLLGAPALSPPFNTASASTIAEVDVDIDVAPAVPTSNSSETSELQDSAVFSLTAQGSGNTNAPCE